MNMRNDWEAVSWRDLHRRTRQIIGEVGVQHNEQYEDYFDHDNLVFSNKVVDVRSEWIGLPDGNKVSFGYWGSRAILLSPRLAELRIRRHPDMLNLRHREFENGEGYGLHHTYHLRVPRSDSPSYMHNKGSYNRLLTSAEQAIS